MRIVSFLLVFLTSFHLFAVLPPLSQEARNHSASYVVEGFVQGISSTYSYNDDFVTRRSKATLVVTKVHKGDVEVGQLLNVSYGRITKMPDGFCGNTGQYSSMKVGTNVIVYATSELELLEPNGFDLMK